MKHISLRFGLLALSAVLVLPVIMGCSSDSMSSQITLTTSRSSIPSDGATTAEIVATILGYDGEPVPIGSSVHFTTSKGQFTNGLPYLTVGTTDTSGTVRVYLMAPLRTVPGAANVTCQSNDVTRSITVEITLYGPPGETARIVLTAVPVNIPTDGATPSIITATLTDGNGDPVNIGTSATFTTDRGIFQNGSTAYTDVTRDVSGTIVAYLTAPRGTRVGPAAIECTSNGVIAQTTVMIGGNISLTATASPASIPADGATNSAITATVTTSGVAVAGVVVKFETLRGEFSHGKGSIDVTTNSAGTATAYFIAPIGTEKGPCQITVMVNGVSVQVVVVIT